MLSKRYCTKSNLRKCSVNRGLLVFCILTIQNTALVLLTKFSYRKTAVRYAASTVIVCAESLKLIVSCVLLGYSDGKLAVRQSLYEVPSSLVRLALPCVLYVVQNNLLFHGVRLLSPNMYIVCSQSKIVSSAIWNILLLQKRITQKQCVALFMLICGMIMVQVGEKKQSQYSADSTRASASDTVQGIIAVFTAALTSGFAGTYLEKIYTTDDDRRVSVWYRNTQLAFVSIPVAIMAAIWKDRKSFGVHGVFQGYNSVVWGIIVLQAFGGLIVALVLRHAGNVLKCFSVSLSICFCTVATLAASDSVEPTLSMTTLLGTTFVIGSVFVYSNVI